MAWLRLRSSRASPDTNGSVWRKSRILWEVQELPLVRLARRADDVEKFLRVREYESYRRWLGSLYDCIWPFENAHGGLHLGLGGRRSAGEGSLGVPEVP